MYVEEEIKKIGELDGLFHIRRGKLDEKDPLRKYLQAAVVGLDRGFAENIKKLIIPSGKQSN
ncbi:hypothetical protein A3A54_02800 [Candidatus Curtissbacteria bacterium RIFCSPLOWO2_01_FULL_39_62]|uniref:Uncharacterized protein n=2 Tax=Candidatus Curtissiibacteriota TaxID=1752717 RepID=A0A1F5G9Y4_9BACT|nr:MAG: hypothetical protein US98_C0040G0002 [Parcubacteria group bacterium GW2011_GWC1_38_6]OGD83260.1 MAG: hypothetical protein A2775_02155 [Candidatus Curtissbacteria bacterium RIFCSPHIGHO2_01_FULL_39_57]OGD88644.1 MAG: hypothetical protein A3D04_00235 [Candidatus Curtissbacteria bacterium RIFCSPHIGHO2_02_FULL_40_16b]OGD90765.1 MAG: hypothetical protein A3E11_01510 [Candidatus Curtissbacteria bacterium RIFCSPHIGHO2_12_FULL_38_37]OGD99467.1 MAG: hypothetical protein A3J17_01735 [Candidatus Cu